MANLKFNNWLQSELDNRGWSQRELSKRAGFDISQTYISLVLAGEREPTWDFCAGVAKGLGYSPIQVFRVAGLLPGGNGVILEEIKDVASRLPDDKRFELLRYAEFLTTK